MKLIFNPFYDQPTFIGAKAGCLLNVKYVGPIGLLGELELRAGLTQADSPQIERLLAYCSALKAYAESVEHPDELFYWESFKVDMLSVAKRLLEWRDALVYAGLNKMPQLPQGLTNGASKIISDLRQVETHFDENNAIADRWVRLMQESNYLSNDWEIQIEMLEELVDPVIKTCILQSRATCRFVTELPELTHEVSMLKFSNLIDGYQWVLTQEDNGTALFINEDNVALNAVLDSLGRPNVDSEAKGVFTQMQQLFTSGLRLFSKDIDYSSLVSYLSIPYHPLNDYQTSEGANLKHALLKHLQSVGGFGMNEKFQTDWNSIIKGAKPKDGRRVNIPIDYCIEQWKLPITLSTIEEYCKKFAKWISNRANAVEDSVVRELLMATKESFDLFPSLLKLIEKETLSYKELQISIDATASLCSYSPHMAQVGEGTIEVVSDIKAIAADCHKAVWMDCYDRGITNYTYSFLTHKDIVLLNQASMMIPLYESRLKAESVAMHLALSHIKGELVILTPEKVEGRRQYPTTLSHWDGEPKDMTQWTTTGRNVATIEANSQCFEHEVDSSIFKGLKKDSEPEESLRREYESHSSLEMLIKNPFDYVLNYIFKCRATDSNSMLSTTKGNVAHKLINNAVCQSKGAWDLIKQALTTDFDTNFKQAVHEVGVELLSSENTLTLTQFKGILQSYSLPAFIQIVEENNLTIVGSELDIMVDLPSVGKFNAKIDMLLKNASGRYIVMDFKWTDSSTKKRAEEIINNTEMQLALYAEAVKKCSEIKGDEIEAIGYFMLRQGEFLTEYDQFKKSKHICVLEKKEKSPQSIWEMVRKAYLFRMEQLTGTAGISVIEEGEQMKVTTENPAYKKAEGLFPLNYPKETSYGKNVVLKGMLQ